MRSSKSRSRGNKNRNTRPTGGNIINRVFESSGPDGKVRGTPQQIIEKYSQLHRDAQLANDRVNAENFSQHAEHYTRMLAEAMREVDRAREEQEQFARDRQSERDRERQARVRHHEEAAGDPGGTEQPEMTALETALIVDLPEASETGLVETPEEQSRRNDRRDRVERQSGERQGGERQGGERQAGERQSGERQGGERQGGERQAGDRQGGERQPGERQGSERQPGERQAGERQGGERQDRRDRQDRDRPDRSGDSRQGEARQPDQRQNDPRPPRPDRRERQTERPVDVAAAPELPAFLTSPTFAPEPVTPETAPEAATAPAPRPRRTRKPKVEAGQPEAAE